MQYVILMLIFLLILNGKNAQALPDWMEIDGEQPHFVATFSQWHCNFGHMFMVHVQLKDKN